MALACDESMMPTTEAILAVLRRLVWESADILRAYARSEQPPFGYPPALSVDHGGEGPVSVRSCGKRCPNSARLSLKLVLHCCA